MLIKVNHRWLEVECESNNFRKQIQSYNHNVSIQIVFNATQVTKYDVEINHNI